MASMVTPTVDYPTSDGKPMAETPLHRQVMTDLIQTLEDWYSANPQVYVSGNLMVYDRDQPLPF